MSATFSGDLSSIGGILAIAILVFLKALLPGSIKDEGAYRRSWIYLLASLTLGALLSVINASAMTLLASQGAASIAGVLFYTLLIPYGLWILFLLSLYRVVVGHGLFPPTKPRN